MIFYVSGINRDLWDFKNSWDVRNVLGFLVYLGILGIFGIFRDFLGFLGIFGILAPLWRKSVHFTFREQLCSCQPKYASVKDR